MIAIIVFFVAHWYASVFAQSFFLHRYAAHGMFRMSAFWRRFFYLFTWIAQGSSYLNPRAYAILHLEHHKHSDTEKDPHSPHFFEDVVAMMVNTKNVYQSILRGAYDNHPDVSIKEYPSWRVIDKIGDSWLTRIAFAGLYTAFYIAYAPSFWWFALLPIHFLMGPVHGAFVNWCGHKYGYANYDNHDHSRNTFVWDLFFVGECFQNNHHRYPRRANFAKKWFELDLTYPVIKLLNALRIIRLKP